MSNNRKLLFLASYNYPAFPAQFRHGLIMARHYSAIKKEFLYGINFTQDEHILEGIPFVETNPLQLPLRKYRLLTLWYFFWLGFFLLRHSAWRASTIITQESRIAHIAIFWRHIFALKIVYECQGLHVPSSDRYVATHADLIIFVTEKTLMEAKERLAAKAECLLLPNAVDLEDYDLFRDRQEELRTELSLPKDKMLIGYIGRFFALGFDKGIAASLQAFKEARIKNTLLCLVGGTEREIALFRTQAQELDIASEVVFVPYQADPRKVVQYICAMDILIYLPPPEKFFLEETSPMKLFEYMAAKKPIVVSDFPAMHEILDMESALFVDPLKIAAVGKMLAQLADDASLRGSLAAAAYEKIRHNTWEHRARTIVEKIERTS